MTRVFLNEKHFIITYFYNQLVPRIWHGTIHLQNGFSHPILKKPDLDPDDLHNYRTISNLLFLSKILERVVATRLHQHMSYHELYELLQSGFRARHGTQIALIKITNKVLITADSGHIKILILLDLSAAFDTISDTIHVTRLSDYLGLTITALSGFQFYQTNRKQKGCHHLKLQFHPSSSQPRCASRLCAWTPPLHHLHAPPWSDNLQTQSQLPLLCQ